MSTPGTTFRKGVLFGVSLFLAGAAVETGLRLLSPVSGFYPNLSLRPHKRFHIVVKARGVSPRGEYTTNSLGIRGEEPPSDWGKFRTLIAVGGSTTECFVLDDRKTWPFLLQENLRKQGDPVWVGNAGVSGDTSLSHLLFIRQFVPRHPPQVLIFLTGLNDLASALSGSYETRIFGGASGFLDAKNSILAASRTLQLLRRLYNLRWTLPENSQNLSFSVKPIEAPLVIPDPRKMLLPGLNAFRTNLSKVIDSGKAMGIRMIFLTDPTLFTRSNYWEKIDSGNRWFKTPKKQISGADMRRLIDCYNSELLELCRSKGVECLDLGGAISGDGRYFYDSTHFNEEGTKKVADFLTNYLLKTPPPSGKPAFLNK